MRYSGLAAWTWRGRLSLTSAWCQLPPLAPIWEGPGLLVLFLAADMVQWCAILACAARISSLARLMHSPWPEQRAGYLVSLQNEGIRPTDREREPTTWGSSGVVLYVAGLETHLTSAPNPRRDSLDPI